ncbi:MAG: PDZ domain-containing protein [Planctomycetota bacterium]
MRSCRTAFAVPLLALCLGRAAEAQVRPDAVLLRHPDVSAEHIVFRFADDLWLVAKEGGVARRLTTAPGNESFPKFSPDGSTVAFLGGYDGGSDLYTLAIEAGAPERVTYHPDQEVLCDWTPDGEGLLYWSSEVSGIGRAPKILRVPAGGGQPEALPVPYGTFGSIDETGTWLAYTPYSREFRTWKRYRGGRAPDVWLYNLKTNEALRVTDSPANDQLPMWHGAELIFSSDSGEEGVFNLYSFDTRTRETTALTDFRDVDVKFPSIGPEDVVFEAGGKLYRLDLTQESRPAIPVEVLLPGERPELRPRSRDVSALVAGGAVGPGGVRVALEARGDVFTVPVDEGITRNLTASSGVAERSPAWSPDGRWMAYFSDRSGEYELTVQRADGKPFEGANEHGERRLTSLGAGWKDSITWSPDSKKLAVGTSHGVLYLCDFETGATEKIHENHQGFPLNVDWSHDAAWLAWSHRHPDARQSAIYLHDVANAATHVVTSGMFDDSGPTFDRSGDFLYFSSSRTFEPVYADLDTTWIYANTRNLCAVPLRADVENPFAPENQEEEVEEDEAEDEDESEEGSESEADADAEEPEPEDEGDADAEGETEGEEEEADEPLAIDLEGFESRVMILPAESGRIGGLLGAEGKVLFVRAPRTGADGQGSQLCYFDLAEGETKTVLSGRIETYRLAAKGTKIAVSTGAGVGVVDLAPGQTLEPADLSGLVATVDPRAEWRQLLRDAWRLYRDFFYDPGLHGVDWNAVGERYARALDDATSRGDVHWLIGEMMSELNVGHAYNSPPMDGMPQAGRARPTGLLGCDWELADGAYRIARIFDGGYDADARSPLAAHGVDANEGDYLLAVNGRPVDPGRAVYAAFEGTAGRPTVLTLCAAPSADGSEREVVIEPMASESSLRYRAWVADNRAKVEELGGGRVGYVHVPDTGLNGQNELMRQFLAQQHKDALLIDERWNGGGQIPTRFIELLDRPVTNHWALHAGEEWDWPPVGHRGPKAMLINYSAGSGGDCFPYYFRQRGLGKLIGMRTWGGLVGISGNPSLIDGASPTVPTFGFFELDGTWGVEGYGVPPDIEVIDNPAEMQGGRDPQLITAVEHLLEELEGWSFQPRVRPASADRRGAGVAPADR